MCRACGGTCGATARPSKRTTIDVRVGSRTLRVVDAGGPAPLFVSRTLAPETAGPLAAWARAQGFTGLVPADDLHVTVAYSRAPVDWFRFASWMSAGDLIVPAGGPRRIEAFKDGVVVLRFASEELSTRWQQFRAGGCSWDFPDYAPHVTVAGGAGAANLTRLKAYTGPLLFGPEEFAPIRD